MVKTLVDGVSISVASAPLIVVEKKQKDDLVPSQQDFDRMSF